MGSVVLIRMAREGDAGGVAHLWYQLSLHHAHYHPYYAVKDASEQLLVNHVRDLMHRSCVIFVAEVENTIVGFVSGYVVQRNPQLSVDRVGRVDNIFVSDEYRGQSIGTQLLDHLMGFFRGQGLEFFEISCDIQNPGALRLYKKLGFEEQKMLLVKRVV